MTEMSKRFNFDDFDGQIADALDGNDTVMADIIAIRRPGAIGAAVTHLTYHPEIELDLPEPPEAA